MKKITCPTCEGKGCKRCNQTGQIVVMSKPLRETRQ